MDAADERGKTGLVVSTVKPLFVPSLEGRFEREIKEVALEVCLDANTTNDFLLSSTWMIF
jgi:hypothetical protein